MSLEGAPPPALGAALRGFGLPLAALRLLLRERRLWPFAALPLLLSTAAVIGALAAVVVFAGELHALTQSAFPELRAESGYAWLWVGPLVALFFVLDKLLFLLAAALVVAAAFVLASLLAAPFHDALSRRVEELLEGSVRERAEPGLGAALRQGGRALRDELRKLLLLALLTLPLAALGLLVPGGQLVAAPALAGVSMLFLTLDYTSYTFDRRGIRFAEKRRWLRRHLGASLGFGAAALLLCALPGLNLLALPVLVVAGTLLALRSAPPAPDAPTSPDEAGRTATSP